MEIKIESVSSICHVEDRVDPKSIFFSSDNSSAYCIVLVDEIPKIGLSFVDFGVPPVAIHNSKDGLMYVGFGRKLIIVETVNCEKVAEYETSSAVFDLLYCDETDVVVLSCETSLYLFIHETKIDTMEFPDIVIDCDLNNKSIHLSLDNGESYDIPLSKYISKQCERNMA